MTGRVFNNRYEILEEIGKGGMAYVYKARCKLLNRIVAIKVLRDDLEGDSEFLKRFNTEATAAANLTHPNIVSIFDVGVHEERHYIVMEYVNGITLKEYILKNAPLDAKEALSIAYQICDALQSAHEKGIVHRDIKSHNILIDSERRVKVTDFGIARATSGSTMTATDNILGSVHYISPEQARGGYVDCKTDLYSLGVVLYEMLTGKLPFDNESPLAVAMMHCNDTPVSISELNENVPETIEALVMKCLKKETSERYQNASNLKADIMKLLENPNCDLYGTNEAEASKDTDDEIDFGSTQVLKAVTDDMLAKTKQSGRVVKKADDDDEEKPSKKMFIGAIATAFVIVGLFSLFATYVFFPNAGIFKMFSSEDIKVPDLTNYSYEQAEEILTSKKLQIEIKDERESGEIDEGNIISQNPKSGRYVKKDSIVFVVVSKGAKSIRLEDYTDKEYKTAKIALEKLGFEVDKVEQNDNEVAENHIIKQKPQGGEIAEYGSLITLYVSTGIEDREVVVPRLVGETIEKAKKLIEQNELTVGDITYEKSVLDKGIVIKQSIGAGESTNVTTAIELVVSNGDQEVEGDDTSKNQKEKLLSIALPQDREQVTLKICANGAKIHESIQEPKINPEYSLKVKGSSITKFEIYFDGILHDSQTIDFSK